MLTSELDTITDIRQTKYFPNPVHFPGMGRYDISLYIRYTRDEGRCYKCGKVEHWEAYGKQAEGVAPSRVKRNGVILIHLDGNPQNFAPENLATLCTECLVRQDSRFIPTPVPTNSGNKKKR